MINGNNPWKLLRYSGGPIIPKNWTLLTYSLCLIFSLVSTSPILIFNNDQIEKYIIIITTLVFVPGVILQKMEKKFLSNDFFSSVENLFKRKKYSPEKSNVLLTQGILGILAFIIFDGVMSVWMIFTILLYGIITFLFSDYYEYNDLLKKYNSNNPIELIVQEQQEWDLFYNWVDIFIKNDNVLNSKNEFLNRLKFILIKNTKYGKWQTYAEFDIDKNEMIISKELKTNIPLQMYEYKNVYIKVSNNKLIITLPFSSASEAYISNFLLILAEIQAEIENKEQFFIIQEAGILNFSERESINAYPLNPIDVMFFGVAYVDFSLISRFLFFP